MMSPTDSRLRSLEQPITPHNSSFKDPSGFVFTVNGTIYRQINHRYAGHYDCLMKSGLYEDLTKRNWLIAHTESNMPVQSIDGYKIIKPEPLRHISYPYEWSFSQLKAAALLTLGIAKKSLAHKMILKDATPFNVQFANGKPVFIDTLSFELYRDGDPWVAYRQFCETFLAPLALMYYRDETTHGRMVNQIHGLSVKQTAASLPLVSCFNSGLLMHIHFQSWFQGTVSTPNRSAAKQKLPQQRLLAMLNHLEQTVHQLSHKTKEGVWGAYYDTGVLDQEYVTEKSAIIQRFLSNNQYASAIDLGSNSGHFAKLMANTGIEVVAVDSEHRCIDDLYRENVASNRENILPLLIDLTNPSPAIGWMNTERSSFMERFSADLVVALALVHHLVIGRNVPFEKVAQFCAHLGNHLIIEFVPKSDPKVQLLLAHREDVFDNYTQAQFVEAFQQHFHIREEVAIAGTERVLYLLEKK